MKSFMYTTERFYELKNKIIIKTLPVTLVVVVFGLYLGYSNAYSQGRQFPFWLVTIPALLIAIIATGFGFSRAIKRQKELYGTYRLTIDENSITREQNDTPTAQILKHDITQIIKNADGSFLIKGKGKNDIIYISPQIKAYAELENLLRQIRPISESISPPFLFRNAMFPTITMMLLMGAVYLSNDKSIATLGGLVLIGLLTWSFTEIKRSKNIDNNTKKSLYFGIFVLLSIIGRIASLWIRN